MAGVGGVTKNVFLNGNLQEEVVSPRVPLIEVMMITNQGYWLLMVNIEISDRLKLIKHQMKIFQALRWQWCS